MADRAMLQRAEPAGEPLAQTGDGIVEGAVSTQRGATQEARLHEKPKPLLGRLALRLRRAVATPVPARHDRGGASRCERGLFCG